MNSRFVQAQKMAQARTEKNYFWKSSNEQQCHLLHTCRGPIGASEKHSGMCGILRHTSYLRVCMYLPSNFLLKIAKISTYHLILDI